MLHSVIGFDCECFTVMCGGLGGLMGITADKRAKNHHDYCRTPEITLRSIRKLETHS